MPSPSRVLLFLLAMLGFESVGWAVQSARVQTTTAAIHEKPDSGSAELATLKKGQTIEVSSESIKGWYHVRVPGQEGKLGWIEATEIRTDTLNQELLESSVESKEQNGRRGHRNHIVALSLFYDYGASLPQGQLGDSNSFVVPGSLYGFELGFRPDNLWTLGIRFEKYKLTHDLPTFSYALSGTGLYLNIEYFFLHELPWKLGFAGDAGFSTGTLAEITAPKIDITSEKFSAPAVEARFTFRRYFGDHIGLGLELGSRYARKLGVMMSNGRGYDFFLLSAFGGLDLTAEF